LGGRRCGRTKIADVTIAHRLRYPSDLTDEEWSLVGVLNNMISMITGRYAIEEETP
jgi:hypothetical protein